MATKTNSNAAEAHKQLTYLASALKAPRIAEAAGRLADHAREAGPRRTTWPPSWNGKSRPAMLPAANSASVPPGSVRSRRWRTSTPTPNLPTANRLPRWPREGS
jgi:hypothetical protein